MLSVYNEYIKRYFKALMVLAASVTVLVYSEQTAAAVRQGIELCVNSVLPSLFCMMFLSQYLIKSGAAEAMGKWLDKPVRLLFGLPGVCGAALLAGMTGGFPAGAKSAEELVESGSISRRQGQRLASIAFCSGPGFTIGMVGAELYGNKLSGVLILTEQIVSVIIIGVVMKIVCGGCADLEESTSDARSNVSSRIAGSDAFVESVSGAASTSITMCSFIVMFQIISSMLDVLQINSALGSLTYNIGLGDAGRYLLPCLLEVTRGSFLSLSAGLPFTAFVVGFGGLSVHFQNFAICWRIRLKKSEYLFIRLVQGLICALLTEISLKLPFFSDMYTSASLALTYGSDVEFSRISYGFGALMLLMCLMSVICLPSKSIDRTAGD